MTSESMSSSDCSRRAPEEEIATSNATICTASAAHPTPLVLHTVQALRALLHGTAGGPAGFQSDWRG
jgi:hypothetical protein